MSKLELKFMSDICLLDDELNRTFLIKNTGFSLVRLLFLKYVTDNFLGAETKDDTEHFTRLQKQFAARDVGGGPNLLIPVLNCVDKHYKLNGLISSTINDYAKELFDLDDSWSRKSTSQEDFERIMGELSKINLEETGNNDKGKFIVKTLIENIQHNSVKNRNVSESISRFELGEIAREILNVNTNDTFLDFAAGAGLTTITIVKDTCSRVINCDFNKENLSIVAMLLIMYGYKNFELKCEDTLGNPNFIEQADKIFVDSPISHKMYNARFGVKMDTGLIAVDRVVDCLVDNGIGIVTINSNALYGASLSNLEIKKRIVNNRYLQAVISLPFSWLGSVANINLILLSKKKNEKVLFVNCSNKAFSNYYLKDKYKGITLKNDGINQIATIIKNNSTISNISKLVSYQEIEKNNFNLMPNTYVADEIVVDSISIEEIDFELERLYAQLGIKK